MAEYNKKWADLFPATIGNQNRPAAGVDNTLPYETDKFPQHIANDPVRYDKMNAVVSQSMSNDERLNEKIERTSDDLAAHNKDPKAHATGIAGNAATASKLLTPRTISLTGKAAGSTSFDGSSNAAINVTSVNADTASKLSTARKINITGNATGSATFDGSGDVSISTTVNESKHAAAADNSNKLGGFPLITPGAQGGHYGAVPLVGGDGVIEIGRYIDWHVTNGGTEDYSSRWEAKNDGTVSVGTINGTLKGNADSATNADKVDGVHAGSLFYNKGDWASDNWATIGTYQVNNNPPVSDAYGWGQVISSSTTDGRFQLYASHQNSNGRLRYRTGWDNDKSQPWNTILDSENYNLFAPTKTGGGASGTWGINISGNAAGLSGDLVFPEIGNTNTSQKITWNGSTDGADIYYQTTASDQGNLVLNLRDDPNCYLRIAANGAFKSYFSPDGVFHGTATNADTVDGYHASDLLSKMQGVLPKTAAEVGQFRELVVNDSHQIKLPDGGTWAYFAFCYTSWSGDNSDGEHRIRMSSGIAAGGTVIHTDSYINSGSLRRMTGTSADNSSTNGGAAVGGFCWRIA